MDTHSMKPLTRLSWLFLCAVTGILAFSSCNKKHKLVRIDPEFSKYIEAYTSGVVSKKSAIRLQLAVDAVTTHALNEPVKAELFDFSPSVKGTAYWVDARTIEFRPEKDLKPNELYEITFKLGKVLQVPAKFKNFRFNVQVTKPAFQVNDNGLTSTGKDQLSLAGEVLTADVEESAKVEKLLAASLNGTGMKISWQHNEANKTHGFVISNIKREKTPGTLFLSWNGDAFDIRQSDKRELQVPAVGDFKVLDVKAVQEEEQYVLVQFSDPVKVGQMLEGLITINEQDNLGYTILGSEVKIYAPSRLDGNYTVSVNEGIENQWGDKLDKGFTSNLFFENRLPSVKIHGSGAILPNSGGRIVLPFDATNLKAVDVSVIKVYETNVAQFLQRNDLLGDNELRRVAKPLVQATVRLDGDKTLNLNRRNRFSLDIDKYIQAEPGAIYRVTIGFRPEYSLYTCAAKSETSPANEQSDDEEYYEYEGEGNGGGDDEDEEFWARYDRWYPYGYNWQEKDNPCSNAYYSRQRFESRNIISSNIGLTAKKGTGNTLLIAASDIITTGEMSDVEISVLDFQQQVVAKGNTNKDGIAMLELKRKPYLVIAKKGEEKGYLKIDDGSALPLGKFDVAGAEVKNGIKGFIFGERGVWRPGDSLFLGFIVEDKDNRLPKDHPIEMELYSPRGQLYKKMVSSNSPDGFNVFRTATNAEAPTGNWTCKMKIGGAVFEKKLKIETVMPNRLKIDLDFGGLTALGKDAKANGTLSAKWLFGATAQNLKARVDAQLYKKKTTFPRLDDYAFDNPTASFAPQNKTIFDGALSAEGTAVINPAFDVNEQAPGMLLANLMVKVFEPGGNFSVDNVSMPYHPYSSYVGVKVPKADNYWGYLPMNKTQQFDIVDVNTEGAYTNGATNIEVELYKIQWKWWWDNSGDDMSNFTQDNYNKLVKKETITLSNGRGSFSNKFSGGSWGRYLVLLRDTRSGHVTGATFYVDDDSWRSRQANGDDDRTSATMLSFTADKGKYNVGEKVNLTIPSSEGGKALVSIESGSKVLRTYWVKTTKGKTDFSFTAEKEMSPNIYVNVSLIQPHAQTLNDLPIRMYGVIPVMVEDKKTILRPQINIADAIRPEKPATITVSEANGNSMSYVIAIVDEGLLDLTRFKTPNPHDAFYAREALGVKSWDLYDYVIGAWGGELERILTIGGDAEGDLASKTRKANRFKPVVKFMGPFRTNGGSKTHTFTLPAYMGSVRAMVIAVNKGAYGMAEKAVKVKSPLMILPAIPRVLGPAETVSIPVTVFATENNIKNVNISLEANGLLQPVNKTVVAGFKGTGEQTIMLSAIVKNNTGIGNIKVVATGGKERAVYETEIEVRNPNPLTTQVKEYVLQPGQAMAADVTMIGDAQSSKATLELSSIPPINLQKRLSYLIQYPHGCIEQTTSSVFPQLVLNQLMQLDDRRKAEIDRNIRSGIQRIQNFQQSDGGFSYWPGFYSEGSDDWGSNYAGHFLLEASARGYIVPSNVLQQWKAFERKKALSWNVTEAPWYGSDLTQAYRLYLLALAKAPEIGAMNRLREFKFLSPEGRWRLAAAYYLTGQNQVALQLISGLPVDLPARKDPGFTYGSDMRDEAMILETLTMMGRRAEAFQVLKSVAARLAQDYWYSTQTTAYSLIAIAKFSGNYNGDNKISATASVNGQQANINTTATVSQNAIAMPGGKGKLQLKNNGSNVLYVRVISEGKPIQGQPIVATNDPSVLQVGISYLNSSGQPIDIAQLKQGTDFVAKVTVKNPVNRTYTEMALSQIFPSGWEILNTRLYNSEGIFKSSPSEYMDIRDDRVYHYFDIRSGETLTYYVQLNAAYLGKYYWPGVYAEAMYDHGISGGVNGKWVEVIQ